MGKKLSKEQDHFQEGGRLPDAPLNASGSLPAPPNSQNNTGAKTAPKPPPAGATSTAANIKPTATASTTTTSKSADSMQYDDALSVDDFDLLKVLGKGSFGKVMLVRRKKDKEGTLYAMKTLRKSALAKRNQLAHTSTERIILQNINSPFLVHLVYAFQTTDKLYMVLDYMGGGELFFWLKRDKKFSENRCRLYGAEILSGIEALHQNNIIYRDLKPENILLDLKGHLKLTDFGLTKAGISGPGAEGGTNTFCGTPEYLAPEILENKGHGKAVDWWALGTLMFEMLTGLPPFYDSNVQRMYHKILHEPLRFPKSENRQVSDGAKETLRGLLERKISDRLGSGVSDADELKRSAFFRPLSFERVLKLEYEPEFKPPPAASETDVSNFDAEFTKERAVDSVVVTHMSETMQEKTKFEGFTFDGDSKLK